MKSTKSAGGVVVNPSGFVAVVNQDDKSWSLPKGHIDAGETTRQAAEREISEETGITQLLFVKKLGSYERYRIGLNGGEDTSELKNIVFYLYKTNQTELKPVDPRHPEARWMKNDTVDEILTHPKDKEFYRSIMADIEEAVD